MTIAGTGGSHRDGIRPYPHFSAKYAVYGAQRLLV